MAYCGKCGAKLKDDVNFCGSCGNKIKEKSTGVVKKTKKIVKKTTSERKGMPFIFWIFMIICIYLVADYVAVQYLELETSVDSLVNSAKNAKVSKGLTSAGAETTIRLKNPTPIPVFLTAFSYDVSYGNQPVVEGRTGVVFIMPFSNSDVNANVDVSYINAGSAMLDGLIDLFKGEQTFELRNVLVLLSTVVIFQLFFLSVGMFISVSLRKIGSVLSFSMGLGLGLYILNSLRSLFSSDIFGYISPYTHFNPAYILVEGNYHKVFTIISLLIIIVSLSMSYFLYLRRNIPSL